MKLQYVSPRQVNSYFRYQSNTQVLDSRQRTGVDRLIMIIIPRQYLQCSHHGRAIAGVHTVHLMNIERRQAVADPRLRQMT